MKTVDYKIVIPARMASQRLPGKALSDLGGKTLIEHVYLRACESGATEVVIATDDERIRAIAEAFGAQALMTSNQHTSGSDRVDECARIMAWPDDSIIVNLQGDEPQMPADCLDQVASLLASDARAQMASLLWPLDRLSEVRDPNVVKVVTAKDGSAIYFSRSVIPFARESVDPEAVIDDGQVWNRHIGLYAYRVRDLRVFSRQPPTPLEQAEKLEQLRVLETGGRIIMAQACCFIPAGVDTPEDLERVRSEIK